MTEWSPNETTISLVEEFYGTLVSRLPVLLGIDEIIPGCPVTNVDTDGVGVGTTPRYITVEINENFQSVFYRSGATISVGDIVTVAHFRNGDLYEVLTAGGPSGSVGGGDVYTYVANVFTTAPQTIETGAAANVGLVIELDASQSADAIQVEDSGGNTLGGFDERGVVFSDADSEFRNFFAGANAGRAAATGYGIVAIGYHAGDAVTSGGLDVLVGMHAGTDLTEAEHCVYVGYFSGQSTTTGGYNVGVGAYSTRYTQTGEDNTGVGWGALEGSGGTANYNYMTALGSGALADAQTGSEYDTAVGYSAGGSLTTGDRNLFLGAYAGYRQTTGNDILLVDNRQRADAATELTHSILYGVMGANPEDQSLTINVDALTLGTDADSDVVITFQANSNNGVLTWMEDEDRFEWSDDIAFVSTARIDWDKITANNVTLNNGNTTDVVADLQTMADGNFYHVDEVAGAPGIDLEVEFTNVDAFNWVHIIAIYDGSTTHSVGIQLYNFSTTTWDTFDALQTGQEDVSNAGEYILEDHHIFVPDDTNYVGTGGDDGDVRVRFHHTMAGNASHDMYIDVVALYQ